jgi:hypothetical protein
MEGARNWLRELRAALVEQFPGPPRHMRWLRFIASWAITIAFALAIPRIDHWLFRAQGWPAIAGVWISMSGVWAVHRERLLGRRRSRQVAVFMATSIRFAAEAIVFVAASVAFGSEPGESPVEHLAAQFAPVDVPLWLVVGLLILVALWNYRSQKREDAALRAQAGAEGAALAPPPN